GCAMSHTCKAWKLPWMTYCPVKARSELRKAKSPGLVSSVNCAGFGAADTRRRFHAAEPAFIHPARSPTRGSGLGAVGDMSNFVVVAQAAATVPIASKTNVALTGGSVEGVETGHPA